MPKNPNRGELWLANLGLAADEAAVHLSRTSTSLGRIASLPLRTIHRFTFMGQDHPHLSSPSKESVLPCCFDLYFAVITYQQCKWRRIMLTQYLKSALRKAHYEILPDNGQYYGEISECNGVYATATTLEGCRDELEEVLEEWVLFRVHRNLALPVIDGVELTVKEETA